MNGADQAPVGGEVGFKRFGEAGGRDVLQRAERAEDAGIAHEAVEAAEAIEQGAGEAVDRVHVAQVEGYQRGVPAGGVENFVIELGEGFFRARGGDDVVAGLGEFQRSGAANALGGARDEDDALVGHGGGLAQLGG